MAPLSPTNQLQIYSLGEGALALKRIGAPADLIESMGEAVEKVEAAEDGWNIFLDLSHWLPWGHKEVVPKISEYIVATTEELKDDVDLDANVKQKTEELKNKLLIRRLSDYRQKLSQLASSKDDFAPSEKDADSVQDQNKMVSAGLESSDGNSQEFNPLEISSQREQDVGMKSVVEIHQAEDTRSSEKEPEAVMRKGDLRPTRVGLKIEALKENEKEMRAADLVKNEDEMRSSALEKPEVGMRSASQEEPEARMRSAALEEPDARMRIAALEEPEARMRNAALEEPEARMRNAALEEQEARMRNAALEEPEAGMRNIALEAPEARMRTVALEEPEADIGTVALEEDGQGMRNINLENQEARVEQAVLEKQVSGIKPGRAASLGERKPWIEEQLKAERINAVTREQKSEIKSRSTALKELKEGMGSSGLERQDEGMRNESQEKLQPAMRRRRRGEKASHRLSSEHAARSLGRRTEKQSKQALDHLQEDVDGLDQGGRDPTNQRPFYEHAQDTYVNKRTDRTKQLGENADRSAEKVVAMNTQHFENIDT
jgi:hypothetical protein